MKREIIAEVKLASGEVGYYDDYSKLYLTINKPYGVIYSGTNLTQIKRSIKSGRLKLISGKLFDTDKKPVVEVQPPIVEEDKKEDQVETPVEEVKPEEVAPVKNTEVIEEDKKEEIPAEVTEVKNEVNEVNEVVNEVTEEEKPVKKSRKRTVKTEE